jgi:hypothetical protein
MLGYVLWAIDRFAHLARTPVPATAPAPTARRSLQAAQIGPVIPGAAVPIPAAYSRAAGSPALAPRLAVSYKIVMAITMGYMLIAML